MLGDAYVIKAGHLMAYMILSKLYKQTKPSKN